ncbi:hypothetical protein EV142_11270 [Flavobacterium circumlabens]|uniref:Uncharacterized protein n=1 Tax=Flavobacterium circumlabens TaxID=2133765 RepID=A0ABY2AU63_9FLAO|nr:hypothetical protein EV142_11270 [Flavobacterium circumlabens]
MVSYNVTLILGGKFPFNKFFKNTSFFLLLPHVIILKIKTVPERPSFR